MDSPAACLSGYLVAGLVDIGSGPLTEQILHGPQVVGRAGCHRGHAARNRDEASLEEH